MTDSNGPCPAAAQHSGTRNWSPTHSYIIAKLELKPSPSPYRSSFLYSKSKLPQFSLQTFTFIHLWISKYWRFWQQIGPPTTIQSFYLFDFKDNLGIGVDRIRTNTFAWEMIVICFLRPSSQWWPPSPVSGPLLPRQYITTTITQSMQTDISHNVTTLYIGYYKD